MTDPIEQIKRIDGVSYVCEYRGNYRVVFKHHADSTAIHKIERHTGCSGRIGGTQEHAAYIEYPIEGVDAE